jgi:hypothetical protein
VYHSKEQQEGESKQQFPKSLFMLKKLFTFFQWDVSNSPPPTRKIRKSCKKNCGVKSNLVLYNPGKLRYRNSTMRPQFFLQFTEERDMFSDFSLGSDTRYYI